MLSDSTTGYCFDAIIGAECLKPSDFGAGALPSLSIKQYFGGHYCYLLSIVNYFEEDERSKEAIAIAIGFDLVEASAIG